MADAPQPQIPLAWVGYDDLPIVFVNQIVLQAQPGEFIVTFGQAAAPPTIGTEEQQHEQLAELEYVPIRPVLRMGVTVERLREFAAAMSVALEQYDAAMKRMGDPR